MSDSSAYADSSQARLLDRDLELRGKTELRIVPKSKETPDQYQERMRQHRKQEEAASRERVRGAMVKLEAFLGPPRK